MPPTHHFSSMRFARSVCPAVLLLAPMAVGAQGDELAYCDRLYDLAVRYRGKAIMGEMRPTPDMIVAQEQCKAGKSSEGIATLEHLLRNGKISLPPR